MDEVTDREIMEFDVVIVGAGPAGLAAAIRLKQRAAETGKDVSVVVLEKGSQVGAHILSGAVIDPVALDRLLPQWREQDSPLQTEVSEDRFYYLTENSGIGFPSFLMPPLMSNHGCYIGSLGSLCRWLGEQAEALGVEIYPGISVTNAIFGPNGEVEGVITGDMGVARDGTHKDSYTPGIALTGKYTLLAEGARGSLTKQLIRRFSLDAESGPQKYGIGLRSCGRCRRKSTGRGSCSTLWAGLSGTQLAVAPSSIISARTWCLSALSCISTTPIPTLTRSRSFSAPSYIRASPSICKAAGAFPMAHARSPKAAGRRSLASPFLVER